MAVVSSVFTPTRSYSPFEGMGEAQRLVTAVPRGMIRFNLAQTLPAKPVNDSQNMQVTASLPAGFAYVFSYCTFEIQVDTASDWDSVCRVTMFNGMPGGPSGTFSRTVANMNSSPNTVAADPSRIMDYSLGNLAWAFHTPTVGQGGGASTFLINYENSAAAVQAAGTVRYNSGFYQYELNQAVRFPLNFPLPVGVR